MKKDTDPLLESAGETAEYVRQYVKLQADFFRLDMAEGIAKVASLLLVLLSVGALALFALVMFSLAVAFYLGKIWGSFILAFLCVGGGYVLLAAILWVFKDRWLTNPLLSKIIRAFFK